MKSVLEKMTLHQAIIMLTKIFYNINSGTLRRDGNWWNKHQASAGQKIFDPESWF